jgi:hypothetical protein
MAVAAQPQATLDEQIVEDDELEAALEAREVARANRADANTAFRKADDAAKGRIEQLGLTPGPARCGRFVISENTVQGRHVSFDTDDTTRLSIRTVEEGF